MAISELKLNANVDNKDSKAGNSPENEQPEFVDRSDVLFSYMNMIAYNNRVDLKL
ncbi:hypothetical protein IJG72_04305 [bacterium]|nr:hypothetical protein [bacterium]